MIARTASVTLMTLLLSMVPSGAAAVPAGAQELVVDVAEAEAVLAILAKRRQGQEVAEADWARLFATEGYRRLGERERAMERPFEEESFRAFVLSEELAGREAELAATLDAWRAVDLVPLSQRVLAYLPAGAHLRATVYLTIKPKTNSFVFDLDGDPAIFLYLDPALDRERFTNTVLHELHHIGFGGSCPPPGVEEAIGREPEGVRKVLRWQGAFGEGFAMLAAAGGPDVHPHAVSPPEDRERWDRDVARFAGDLRQVEGFFLELLAGRLDERQEVETARSFYGIQGPWYTVGWKMAVAIEEAFGRPALIDAFCDPRILLVTYNRAAAARRQAGEDPALWSEDLLRAVTAPEADTPSPSGVF